MSSNKETIRKIIHFISKYHFFVAGSLLLSIVSVTTALYVPVLVGKAVDCIAENRQIDFARLTELLLQTGVVTVFSAMAQWLMNVCNNKIVFAVTRDVRNQLFDKIEILPLKYMDGNPVGDTVSRVISDVDQFTEGLLLGFSQFFSGVATIALTIGFMFSIHAKIALVVIIITPISLLVAAFIAKRTHEMFFLQSETKGEQTAFIDEMIGNLKVIKAFGKERKVVENFCEINDRMQKCSQRALFFSSITNPSTRFVNSLVYTGVGLSGALLAISGGISIGQLSCFLSYANQYTKPFNEISGVITELQNALACAVRIFDLMDQKPQSAEEEDAVVLENADGSVEFQNVSFSYDKGSKTTEKLIEDLNLSVKKGQRVAIVGPTGSGKTTLINLLMRFYDVDSGKIVASGYDIRKLTRKSLRSSFGMVLQDTWLKNGTIKENICMGKPDATMEEVIEAARESCSHSFIRRLPKGYDTVIHEDGGNLSAGQKQLLCITRVMLCLPPMLILDEATSSIDTRTELKIQEVFARMMKGRTSFVVAHRLSTIVNADLILVMKDGKIIEQGNHEMLLENNGFYATLYNSQFKG